MYIQNFIMEYSVESVFPVNANDLHNITQRKTKKKTIYNPQKKDRKKILLPLLLYCPLLGISWATSEEPRSSPPLLPPTLLPLQPPYVHFIQRPPDRSSLSVGCSERLHFPVFNVMVKWWVLFFCEGGGGIFWASLLSSASSVFQSLLSLCVRKRPSSIHRRTVLCLRGVRSARCWQRGEWHGEVKAMEGRRAGGWGMGVGGGCRGRWKSIICTDCLPGWLSIRNCKSFSLYLASLLPSPLPPLCTAPVLSADREIITGSRRAWRRWLENWKQHNTYRLRSSKTHSGSRFLPFPHTSHRFSTPKENQNMDVDWKQ